MFIQRFNMIVQNSFIHSSHILETIKCLSKVNRILFRNKNEWINDAFDNMDISQTYYTEWKKLDTVECILDDLVYMKNLE